MVRPGVFFGKVVPKICNKLTGEHPCGSAISVNCKVNLLHIFRTLFPKNTLGRLLKIYNKTPRLHCRYLRDDFNKTFTANLSK